MSIILEFHHFVEHAHVIIAEMESLSEGLCRKAGQTILSRLQPCKNLEDKHIKQYL